MPIVAQSIGIRRLVVGGGIPYPLGNPNLSSEQEQAFRDQLVKEALSRLLVVPHNYDEGNTT